MTNENETTAIAQQDFHSPGLSVRVERWPAVEGSPEELVIAVTGESVNQLRTLLQQATNCRWESLSDEMRWMMDILIFGKAMPSHRDRGNFS